MTTLPQLSRRQGFVVLFILLMFYTVLGGVLATWLAPLNDAINLTRLFAVFVLLMGLAYGLLRLILRMMIDETVSESVRAISRTLPDRAVVLNREGRYVDVINRYQHSGVYQPYGVIGKTVHEIYNPNFANFVLEKIEETLRLDRPQVIEYTNINLAGKLVHYEGRVVPYHDERTGEARVVWSSRDVSERVEAARTALDLATERNRIQFLRDFVSNLTHDIKTPLAIINTNTYIIRKTSDEGTRNRRLERIEVEVEKLTQMVDDMLESARLDGEPERDTEPVNLLTVVTSCANRLKPKADDRSITIETQSQFALPMLVYGSLAELTRALENLLDNAIKYSEDGGQVDVTIAKDNDMAVVVVTDYGIGIARDDVEQIFKRFYRTDSGRFHTSGTGLGLSIVKLIVERHGGTIDVVSAEGEGSSFFVRLPLGEMSST